VRAEEAILKERDRAQKYLDISGVMFVILNTKDEVTLINRKGCEILGYEKEEIIGKNWIDNFLPANTKGEVKTVFDRLMSGETELDKYHENPVLTKGGEEKIIAWHSALLKDNEGNIIGSLGSGEDITERKQMEETLRDSKERFRSIFEQAADSIVLIDTKSRALVEFNDSAHESLGYTHEEFQKLKISDFEASESAEEVVKHIKKLVGEGADAFETKHRTKSGEIRDILVNTRVISIGGRDFALSIWRDITDRKKAEEKLAKAAAIDKARLKELEKFAILVVGRELKMVELKKRIKELELQTLLRES